MPKKVDLRKLELECLRLESDCQQMVDAVDSLSLESHLLEVGQPLSAPRKSEMADEDSNDRATIYRKKADHCRALANSMSDPQVRTDLLNIARQWEELADPPRATVSLSASEEITLRRVNYGIAKPTVLIKRDIKKLIEAGLVVRQGRCLMLTDKGLQRVVVLPNPDDQMKKLIALFQGARH